VTKLDIFVIDSNSVLFLCCETVAEILISVAVTINLWLFGA